MPPENSRNRSRITSLAMIGLISTPSTRDAPNISADARSRPPPGPITRAVKGLGVGGTGVGGLGVRGWGLGGLGVGGWGVGGLGVGTCGWVDRPWSESLTPNPQSLLSR